MKQVDGIPEQQQKVDEQHDSKLNYQAPFNERKEPNQNLSHEDIVEMDNLNDKLTKK